MKRHFTLVEIVIVLIILGILATIGIPLYSNAIEDAKAKACELNLKVLLGALEAYSLENDHLPATLGELRQDDMRKAWAKALKQEGGWKVKLTYFLIDFDSQGLAYAQQSWLNRYIGDARFITCPANTSGGISYGLNANLAGIPLNQYRAVVDAPIIADADAALFATPVARHKKYLLFPFFGVNEYAQAVVNTAAGEKNVIKYPKSTGGGAQAEIRKELKEQAKKLKEQAKKLKEQAKKLKEQAKKLGEQAKKLGDQAKKLKEQKREKKLEELEAKLEELGEKAEELEEKDLEEKLEELGREIGRAEGEREKGL